MNFAHRLLMATGGGKKKYLIVAGAVGLHAVDVTDPSNMFIVDTLSYGRIEDVVIDSEKLVAYAAAFTNDGLLSIDISDPKNLPTPVLLTDTNMNGAVNVAGQFSNNLAFVGSYYGDSITAVDVSNPASMVYKSSLAQGNQISSIARSDAYDDRICAGVYGAGFRYYSVSDPLNMTVYDTISLPNVTGISVKSARAYCVDYDNSALYCISLTNPSSLSVVNSYTGAAISSPTGIALDRVSNIAYVPSYGLFSSFSATTSGVVLLDSVPNSHNLQGTVLNLNDGIAYGIGYSNIIVSIDISDPSNLEEISTLTGTGTSYNGGAAYIEI